MPIAAIIQLVGGALLAAFAAAIYVVWKVEQSRADRKRTAEQGAGFYRLLDSIRSIQSLFIEQTEPHWALGYSWDVVLRGRSATVFETEEGE